MRYTHHSGKPNARLCIQQGRVEFCTLQAITLGEEITVDYEPTHRDGQLACRCALYSGPVLRLTMAARRAGCAWRETTMAERWPG